VVLACSTWRVQNNQRGDIVCFARVPALSLLILSSSSHLLACVLQRYSGMLNRCEVFGHEFLDSESMSNHTSENAWTENDFAGDAG